MAIQTFVNRVRNRLPTLRNDQSGNVIITFALATIPIIGFVGAAVDYSRANSDKAAMQAAVDATALMLSKDAANITTSQLNTKADNYFRALFNRTDVNNIVITPTYTTSGGSQIVVTGTGQVPTTFTKVMGMSALNINVTSTVRWGYSRMRVALVLDNTGSMASANKMTALKTASHGLLTQLQNAAAQNGDVYVSIIPFSKDVNVDPVNYNQNWVDWDDWDDDNGHDSTTTTCTTKKTGKSGKTTKKCTTSTAWVPDNHNTWNGCVTDRDQDYDIRNTAPSPSNNATLFPAEQYDSCPTPILSLTYNWSALHSKIDAMQPAGNTNQAIGLQWGWQSITAAPFTIPPKDPLYTYQDVIILVTDGLNTEDRWYSTQSQIDARQRIACDNIYAAGITLYTVQVNTSGDQTSTLLQNCAGSPNTDPTKAKYPDPDKFFLLTSSSAIVTTFNQIGTELSKLRVAK
jgi:Flp pilus assembly protein TadG